LKIFVLKLKLLFCNKHKLIGMKVFHTKLPADYLLLVSKTADYNYVDAFEGDLADTIRS
jgi:hypothetical protein